MLPPSRGRVPAKVMSEGAENNDLVRERVVIVTDQELIEGTICYAEGIRLSDALNSESAHLSKPHLPLVDASVTRIETGREILRSRFLLVARSKIVVLLPKSEICTDDVSWVLGPPAADGHRAGGPRPDDLLRRETDVPTLIGALKNPDEAARRKAAEWLSRLGTRAKAAIPALLECLRDRDDLVRGQSAEALGNIGLDARAVVAALQGLLRDRSEFVRRMAAAALGDFGPAARATVADLSEALKDKEEFVRRAAAGALGKIGAAAREATPALRTALGDTDVLVRHCAAVALNKILGPATTTPVA